MASIFDDLPPSGLALEIKIALYLGLIYIFLTAFSTWFITRRRAKPVRQGKKDNSSDQQMEISEKNTVTFTDSNDQAQNLRIEKIGLEASMSLLNTLKSVGDISDDAQLTLAQHYGPRLHELNLLLTEVEPVRSTSVPATTPSPVPDTGISANEMSDIEADLQQQLLDLEEDDDFLKSSETQQAPVNVPAPVGDEPEFTPMGDTGIPAPPSKSTVQPAMPTPPSKPGVAMPEPPGKPSIPKAPQKPASAVASPVSAVTPMNTQSDSKDEQIFAKSTSIAALRMDMLRELARLKKLINEDE